MTAYTGQTPDNSGPIVLWIMGLPIAAGCDTAWIRTRVSIVTPLALRCSALDPSVDNKVDNKQYKMNSKHYTHRSSKRIKTLQMLYYVSI